MSWAEIKYWIADKLFQNELDEAFEMGIREGRKRHTHYLAAQLQAAASVAPKTRQPGLVDALEIVRKLY